MLVETVLNLSKLNALAPHFDLTIFAAYIDQITICSVVDQIACLVQSTSPPTVAFTALKQPKRIMDKSCLCLLRIVQVAAG